MASTGCFREEQIFEFSTPESLLDINFAEPVFVLVDRLAVSADSALRIVDATEISFRESGEVIFQSAPRDDQPSQELRFSQRFECKSLRHSVRGARATVVFV